MNKFIIYVFSITLLLSCKVQENDYNTVNSTTSSTTKSNKMYGKIIVKSSATNNANTMYEMPEYYFNSYGVDYYIKFQECKVSKEKIMQYLNKEIDIRGEIRTGKTKLSKQKTKSKISDMETEMNYIIINEILE